jgi:hypothetical protein
MPTGKHLPRVPMICAGCKNPFSRIGSDRDRIYCSWECAKGHFRKPKEQIQCEFCKTTFQRFSHHQTRFCSVSCSTKFTASARKMKNRAADIWPNRREAKTELLKTVHACEECGWDEVIEILELHHLDRNHRHNHRSNLRLLCPNCHTIEHWRTKTGQFANNKGVEHAPSITRGTKSHSTEF